MTRIARLASLLFFSSQMAWAANAQQDMQAEIQKTQAAQARMMAAMVSEKQSRLGFDETVAALLDGARQRGWGIGQPIDMQALMQKAGQKDAKLFKVIPMCKKDLAEALLKTQTQHRAAPFVPCRVSVFEGKDGNIYIAKPNTELLAQMATPVFAPLLQQFVAEEKRVLGPIEKQ